MAEQCTCPVYRVPDARPLNPGDCPVHAPYPARRVRATVGRSATEKSMSGRFYAPIDIISDTDKGKIAIQVQGSRTPIELWPDEAEQLGLALVRLAAKI